MTSLLTAAEAQARGVGTALSSADLQAIIDAEEALMIATFGPHSDGVATVTEKVARRGRFIYLRRPILSVTSVNEASYPGGTNALIAATSYYVWTDGSGRIEMYPGGVLAEASGDQFMTVVYVPIDDRALRKEVLLNIVKGTLAESEASATKVSGLGYSIEASVDTNWASLRARQYRRLGYFEV